MILLLGQVSCTCFMPTLTTGIFPLTSQCFSLYWNLSDHSSPHKQQQWLPGCGTSSSSSTDPSAYTTSWGCWVSVTTPYTIRNIHLQSQHSGVWGRNSCQSELASKQSTTNNKTCLFVLHFFSSWDGGNRRELRQSLMYHKVSLNSIYSQRRPKLVLLFLFL